MSHRQEESIKSSLPNLRNQLPQTPDTELRNLNMTKKSSKMGSILFITILVLSNGKLAFPQMVNVGLENANLIIAGKYWFPYLHYDWDENGTAINYGGVMWDLLLFIILLMLKIMLDISTTMWDLKLHIMLGISIIIQWDPLLEHCNPLRSLITFTPIMQWDLLLLIINPMLNANDPLGKLFMFRKQWDILLNMLNITEWDLLVENWDPWGASSRWTPSPLWRGTYCWASCWSYWHLPLHFCWLPSWPNPFVWVNDWMLLWLINWFESHICGMQKLFSDVF